MLVSKILYCFYYRSSSHYPSKELILYFLSFLDFLFFQKEFYILFFTNSCIHYTIMLFLFSYICCHWFIINSQCTHIITYCIKMFLSYLYFTITYLSKITKILFTINTDTLIFYKIITNNPSLVILL